MTRTFDILLIGGSSGSGKSYLARELSKHYGVPLTEVDDIRVALQQVLEREQHKEIFTFIDNPQYLEEFATEDLVQKLILLSKSLWKAVSVVINKHVVCNEPIIFEGDSLLPQLISKIASDTVKSIFLYASREELEDRISKRNRLGDMSEEQIQKDIDFSYAYGQEIRRQAELYNTIAIPVGDEKTLLARTIKILSK